MRKIDWDNDILGADGVSRNRGDIESFFVNEFENIIRQNINSLIANPPVEYTDSMKRDVRNIEKSLHFILIAKPYDLIRIKDIWNWRKCVYTNELLEQGLNQDATKTIIGQFNSRLLKEFNYKSFRQKGLNDLAVILNVKSCLYCNQQYTIALGKRPNNNEIIELGESDAFIQFDHFFNKSECPILSMSLYNLIPSCPICNHKKRTKDYSLLLHPYVNNLGDKFHFRIKDANALVSPFFNSIELLEVEIDTLGGTKRENDELRDFVKDLKLELRYARHLDIVKELECAKYLDAYYNKSITLISDRILGCSV